MKCEYGCEREAKFSPRKGMSKWCCEDHYLKCPAIKKKYDKSGKNNPNYGKHHSKETKEKISKSLKGKPLSEKRKREISEWLIKQWKDPSSIFNSLEMKNKKSKSMKNKPFTEEHIKNLYHYGMKGKHHTEETKNKIRESNIGKKRSSKTKQKQSKNMKNRWADLNDKFHSEEYWEKRRKSDNVKPNKQEIFVYDLLNKLFPNIYEFVGDYKLWIGGKNPDFVNKKDKKLIEYFGDYYHSKEHTGEDERLHEHNRINHFKKYGYNTLVIWEKELKNIKKLKNKIVEFNNETI